MICRIGVTFAVALLLACAASCKSRQVTTQDAAPPPPPPRHAADCEKDEDCVPMNCCFAVAEDSCIVKARSTCETSAVKIECGQQSGPRYACACKDSVCMGKRTGEPEVVASAGAAATTSAPVEHWVTGGLDERAVLAVIMAHGADIKTCHALAKNASGVVGISWDIAPAGNVTKTALGIATVPSASMKTCIQAKVKSWRFPARKTASHATYTFQFGTR